MKNRFFIIAFAAGILIDASCTLAGEQVVFADFPIESADGLKNGAPGSVVEAALSESAADNSEALEAAFYQANNGGTVRIRAGTYRFNKPIDFANGHNIIFEGGGARFVFTKKNDDPNDWYRTSFLISNCSRLLFRPVQKKLWVKTGSGSFASA